jgi:two-component system response regulator RegX3
MGDLCVNAAALQATREGRDIKLTQREVDLLCYFSAHPHRVIPRTELYEQVWHDPTTDLETRTVDMHIAKLRSKIESDPAQPRLIKTVRGVGYKYED